tara:strand:+ start:1732 stop:2205 length:474 start_codon:yes stop_codon:yes gene_type:complete
MSSLFSKNNFLGFIIIIFTFFVDRVSKLKIINNQIENKSIYINDYVNFELVWNTGIGFGLFNMEANLTYHLISLLIFTVILLIIFFMIKSTNVEKYFYSIILGGAIGNLYDRLTFYGVPDFIDLHYKNYHWFTFNIADIFITTGIILILLKEAIKTK